MDFIVTENGRSFHGNAVAVEGFFCFGLPIVSPCYEQVVQLQNTVIDNAIGEVNLRQNWRNYLLIRLYDGATILLAHLRQHSTTRRMSQCWKNNSTMR